MTSATSLDMDMQNVSRSGLSIYCISRGNRNKCDCRRAFTHLHLARGHRCWHLPESSASPVIGHRQRFKCSVRPPEFTPHLTYVIVIFRVFHLIFPCFPFAFLPSARVRPSAWICRFQKFMLFSLLLVRGGVRCAGCAGIVLWVDLVCWASGEESLVRARPCVIGNLLVARDSFTFLPVEQEWAFGKDLDWVYCVRTLSIEQQL